MRIWLHCRRSACIFLMAVAAACAAAPAPEEARPPPGEAVTDPGATMVQPGAPGEAGRTVDPGDESLRTRHPHTEADVVFMQNMIHHHVQALEMSRLVPDRTENRSIRLLARRIDRSQMDEIRLMQRWLEGRGEEAPRVEEHHLTRETPDHHAHHHHHAQPLMAGMLSPEQMEELAGARGAEFDRLFLEFMIFHHRGALDMVEELLASPGAAQDSEMFQFASHVDGDQRIEIGRMERMLRELDGDR